MIPRLLYHTPLSPTCRKIRILLHEKELDVQLEAHEPWQRELEFFAINPSGEVPVLIEDEKLIICGTYAICEYIEETYPDVQFIGNSAKERAEVRRIIEWFNVKFEEEVTHNIVWEKVFKRLYGYGEPDSDAIRAGKKNIRYHIDYIAHLLMNRAWLAGEYMTLADLSAAAHLSCLDYLGDVPWDHHHAVKEWYALLKSRPSFRPILEDRVMGFRPPAHYTDPDF